MTMYIGERERERERERDQKQLLKKFHPFANFFKPLKLFKQFKLFYMIQMFSNFAYFSIYGLIQQMSHYLPNQSSKKGAVKYYISMIPKCLRSPTPHVCISKINMPLDILPPKKTMLCFDVDPIKCGLNIEFKTSLVKTKFNATFISTN